MSGFLTRDVPGAPVAGARQVEAGQQLLARTQQHRGDRKVQFVDQASFEVLTDRRHPAAETDVLVAGCLDRSFQSRFDAVGDEPDSGSYQRRGDGGLAARTHRLHGGGIVDDDVAVAIGKRAI